MMGGSAMNDDWELASLSNAVRTVVLVGRIGNGKSATGNSILGRKVFKSKTSSSAVTGTCELQQTVWQDGQIVNVIDTPGLFDFSAGSEFVVKEIAKCVGMAKDGIHAILVVFSVRTRFTQEEVAALRDLQTLFGNKIIQYMIVVFTGGDDLEENGERLEDYLGHNCPQPLKEILTLCENRRVLFDNKTKDEGKRTQQVEQLLSLVDLVIAQNGGRPYSDELFVELKKGAIKQHDQQEEVALRGYSIEEILELEELLKKAYDDQMKRITEMVELRLREMTLRLEQQLKEEHEARVKAEEFAQEAQKRSDEEICKLRENLERAQQETDELRNKGGCTIL